MTFENLVYQRKATEKELPLLEGIEDWMWLQYNDAGAWGSIRNGPLYEFHHMRDSILPLCKEKKVMIQAGGCCGMYPRLWSNHFETVYTFEPNSVNFHCLVNNCQSQKIIKINAALSDTHKMGSSEVPGGGRPFSDGGNIPTFRIDDLQLSQCDFIQLDIEGQEPQALKGASETISKHKPVIVLEYSCGNGPKMASFLGEKGYREFPCGHDHCWVWCE